MKFVAIELLKNEFNILSIFVAHFLNAFGVDRHQRINGAKRGQ